MEDTLEEGRIRPGFGLFPSDRKIRFHLPSQVRPRLCPSWPARTSFSLLFFFFTPGFGWCRELAACARVQLKIFALVWRSVHSCLCKITTHSHGLWLECPPFPFSTREVYVDRRRMGLGSRRQVVGRMCAMLNLVSLLHDCSVYPSRLEIFSDLKYLSYTRF